MIKGDIAFVNDSSTWNDGKMRGATVIITNTSGNSYSVDALDGVGGGSWFREKELTFLRHSTKEDVDAYHANKEEVTKNQTDLYWIRDNWSSLICGISANSILTLLHAIGYTSAYEKNGELFVLQDDYSAFFNVFNAIMHKHYDIAIDCIKKAVKPEYVDKYILPVTLLYKKLNPDETLEMKNE